MLGVTVEFVGVLLTWPGSNGGLLQVNPIGAVVLIFAALSWSFCSIYSCYADMPKSPLMGSALEMLAGAVAFFIIGAVTGELSRVNIAEITLNSWLGLAYLIVFGSLIGYTAYTWLPQVAPTSLASTYACANPLQALGICALLVLSSVACSLSPPDLPSGNARYRS